MHSREFFDLHDLHDLHDLQDSLPSALSPMPSAVFQNPPQTPPEEGILLNQSSDYNDLKDKFNFVFFLPRTHSRSHSRSPSTSSPAEQSLHNRHSSLRVSLSSRRQAPYCRVKKGHRQHARCTEAQSVSQTQPSSQYMVSA
jgi:hypothetical protein